MSKLLYGASGLLILDENYVIHPDSLIKDEILASFVVSDSSLATMCVFYGLMHFFALRRTQIDQANTITDSSRFEAEYSSIKPQKSIIRSIIHCYSIVLLPNVASMKTRPLWAILYGLTGFFLIAFYALFDASLGYVAREEPLLVEAVMSLNSYVFGWGMLGGVLLEELVFRMFLMNRLITLSRSTTNGIVVSSALFGIAHWSNETNKAFECFVGGVICGVIYRLSGSLIAPILAHLIANLVASYEVRMLSPIFNQQRAERRKNYEKLYEVEENFHSAALWLKTKLAWFPFHAFNPLVDEQQRPTQVCRHFASDVFDLLDRNQKGYLTLEEWAFFDSLSLSNIELMTGALSTIVKHHNNVPNKRQNSDEAQDQLAPKYEQISNGKHHFDLSLPTLDFFARAPVNKTEVLSITNSKTNSDASVTALNHLHSLTDLLLSQQPRMQYVNIQSSVDVLHSNLNELVSRKKTTEVQMFREWYSDYLISAARVHFAQQPSSNSQFDNEKSYSAASPDSPRITKSQFVSEFCRQSQFAGVHTFLQLIAFLNIAKAERSHPLAVTQFSYHSTDVTLPHAFSRS